MNTMMNEVFGDAIHVYTCAMAIDEPIGSDILFQPENKTMYAASLTVTWQWRKKPSGLLARHVMQSVAMPCA